VIACGLSAGPGDRAGARRAAGTTRRLDRRKMTDEQRAYFRGKDYLNSKQTRGGDRTSAEAKDHFDPLLNGNTAAIVAENHGVGQATMRRDAEVEREVDHWRVKIIHTLPQYRAATQQAWQ